jgi:hypothetical protein
MTPTWSVHATVDEPLPLLQAFVAHYLSLGATGVHLALDRPDDDLIFALRAIDGVTLTLCDDRWWRSTKRGTRPGRTVQRQAVNATRHYRHIASDWMLSCDADEFLWPARPVADILRDTPAEQAFRVFPVAERALRVGGTTILDGPFRMYRPELASVVVGQGDYFADGFMGHIRGKSITRRGLPIRIGTHRPVLNSDDSDDRSPGYPQKPDRVDDALLLHFDGLTPLHLLLKCLRWYDNGLRDAGNDPTQIKFTRKSTRTKLIQAVHQARGDGAALRALLDQVLLTEAQADHLQAQGALLDLSPDFGSAMARHVPGLAPDLSVAAFDRALIAAHADLMARHGMVMPEQD